MKLLGALFLSLVLFLPLPSAAAEEMCAKLQMVRDQAEAGNADAQFSLGMYYQNRNLHTGSTDDAVKSLKWFRKAAEQGNWRAQTALGSMLYAGQYKRQSDQLVGVAQDFEEAYFWLSVAANARANEDVLGFTRARKTLTPEQVAAVEKRAREWKPSLPVGTILNADPAPAPDWIFTSKQRCTSQ